MQIIHLTDLHYRRAHPFQKALIEALLEDAKRRISGGLSPDLVVFSGDLVNNPDDADIYEDFESNFLRPFLTAVNISEKQVVFCPGNHDVSHKAVKEWADEREKLKAAMAADQATLTSLTKSAPFQSYARAVSSGFFALAERLGSTWTNPLSHTYTFDDKKISFVALNSAFACGLEGSLHDRGKLSFPAEEALAAFQVIQPGHQVFSLIHHTTADLSESTSRTLVPILENKTSVHFFGHVHQPRPTTLASPGTSSFMLQGGALYETSGYYNGYSIIHFDPTGGRVAAHYRTYYVDRTTFDVGTNVWPAPGFVDTHLS